MHLNLAAFSLMETFPRITFHKYHILPYLPHAPDWYDIFFFPSEYPKCLAWTGYYNMGYASLTQFEYQISNTSHLLSVTYIDNFLMSKLT